MHGREVVGLEGSNNTGKGGVHSCWVKRAVDPSGLANQGQNGITAAAGGRQQTNVGTHYSVMHALRRPFAWRLEVTDMRTQTVPHCCWSASPPMAARRPGGS